MTVTDPLADALTKIKNAYLVKKEKVDIKCSKTLLKIIDILKKENFIQDYKFIEDNKQSMIRVYLKYFDKKTPALLNIIRISKPGRRVYVTKSEVPKVLSGVGLAILTTSKGILTDEEAKRFGVGGEVICYVY